MVIIVAVGTGVMGFVTEIPRSEFFLHWESYVPFGIVLIILIIISKNHENDDNKG